MRGSILLIPIFMSSLISGAGVIDPKSIVTNILNKILDDFVNKGLDIPEIELGDEVGKFSNITAKIKGKFSKEVSAVGIYGFSLTLSLENFEVKGAYDFLNLEIPLLFPIFGKGDFRISLKGIEFKFTLKARYLSDIEKLKVDIPEFDLSMDKAEVVFENLMNDPPLTDFLNELVSSLIPDLTKIFQGKAVELLKPLISWIMNEVVLCIRNELATGKLEECLRNITTTTFDFFHKQFLTIMLN